MNTKEKKPIFYDQLTKCAWRYKADFGPSTRARYRTILRLLSKFSSRKASIIDVGCGGGDLLRALLQYRYNNLKGCDFSNASIITARQQVGNIVFQADLTIGKISKYKYDVVICADVLEHIQNDSLACKNLVDLLQNNGKVIISVPVNMKYWSPHDDFVGHVRRYEPKRLESLLIQKGFSIVHTQYWGSGLYSLYHFLLRRTKPTTLMNTKKPNFFKKFIAKTLYFLFVFEDYFSFPSNAKRLFVVARKI